MREWKRVGSTETKCHRSRMDRAVGSRQRWSRRIAVGLVSALVVGLSAFTPVPVSAAGPDGAVSVEAAFTAVNVWGEVVPDPVHSQVIYLSPTAGLSAMNTDSGLVRSLGEGFGHISYSPYSSLFSPDGEQLMAPHRGGDTASVIDLETFTIVYETVNFSQFLRTDEFRHSTDSADVTSWVWQELEAAPVGQLPAFVQPQLLDFNIGFSEVIWSPIMFDDVPAVARTFELFPGLGSSTGVLTSLLDGSDLVACPQNELGHSAVVGVSSNALICGHRLNVEADPFGPKTQQFQAVNLSTNDVTELGTFENTTEWHGSSSLYPLASPDGIIVAQTEAANIVYYPVSNTLVTETKLYHAGYNLDLGIKGIIDGDGVSVRDIGSNEELQRLDGPEAHYPLAPEIVSGGLFYAGIRTDSDLRFTVTNSHFMPDLFLIPELGAEPIQVPTGSEALVVDSTFIDRNTFVVEEGCPDLVFSRGADAVADDSPPVCDALGAEGRLTVFKIGSGPQVFEDLFDDPALHRGHSSVLRLYWAVLGREPELGGARYWLGIYDSGVWGPPQISQFFATSPEFRTTYGDSLSNEEFVRVVYENVLGREAEPDGFAYWVHQANSGLSRGELVLWVSASQEFIDSHPLPSDLKPDVGPLG